MGTEEAKHNWILTSLLLTGLLGLASMSSAVDDPWIRKADMPTPREFMGASVVNGIIYAIGGYDVASGMWDVSSPAPNEAYDPATDTWTKKAYMPTARGSLSASVVNGKIYAIGGGSSYFQPRALSTVEMYDPATDTWTKKADMPTARGGFSTSVVNGIIYAIGGWPVGSSRLTQAYDPATDTWTEKADMPTARAFLSTSVVNGKVYAIGGSSTDSTFSYGLSTVEEYDPMTDTWTKKADMPTARHSLSTSVVNGIIYAIGGMRDTGEIVDGMRWAEAFSTVEAYNPAKDTWTKEADMSLAREGLSTSSVNGRIYAIGGFVRPGIHLTPAVEEYNWLLALRRQPQAVDAKGKAATQWGRLKTIFPDRRHW